MVTTDELVAVIVEQAVLIQRQRVQIGALQVELQKHEQPDVPVDENGQGDLHAVQEPEPEPAA